MIGDYALKGDFVDIALVLFPQTNPWSQAESPRKHILSGAILVFDGLRGAMRFEDI